MPDRTSRATPRIVELPDQTMATISTRGDPALQSDALSALYGAVHTLRFARQQEGRAFEIRALRARWPDAHRLPKARQFGVWALPIPDDVDRLPQATPGFTVRIQHWRYGTVAEIVQTGSTDDLDIVVRRLLEFVEASGYEIAGVHEEEYLPSANQAAQQTIIRYPVEPRLRGEAVPRDAD